MAKIGMLFPQESMVKDAEEIIKDQDLDIVCCRAVATGEAVNEARKAVAAGADVLIARGYQARIIRPYINVPIIDVRLTVQEVGFLVRKAISMTGEEHPFIALMGFGNMLPDLTHIGELFDVRFETFLIERPEDADSILQTLERDRPDIIIGGEIPCAAAQSLGYQTLFYTSTQESIRAAIAEAARFCSALEVQRQNEAQIETLLDTSFGGTVRINSGGEILAVNHFLEDLTGKGEKSLGGQRIDRVIPELDYSQIQQVLSGKAETVTTSVSLKDDVYLLIAAPIEYDGRITGALLSFRRSAAQARQQSTVLGGYTSGVSFQDITTDSAQMKHCLGLAETYALSDRPVAIVCSAGAEADRIAQAIHHNSARRAGPYIGISLSDLDPEDQQEALFGRRRAGGSDQGALSRANHGTITIRGLELMTKTVQSLLARLFEPWYSRRVDALPVESADVRLIVTAGRPLSFLKEEGVLTGELYYLLEGLVLTVPSLDRRPEDVTRLFQEYLKEYGRKYGRSLHVTRGGFAKLTQLSFAGGQAQLEAFTERLVLSAGRRQVDEVVLSDLYSELYPEIETKDGEEKVVVYDSPEAEKIRSLLKQYAGNRARVAEDLGISTTTLWRRMKKYGIKAYR